MGRADDAHTVSVAERNAQMGFNDTIDRMAEDFVNVYLVVADPCYKVYSTLGHACLRLQCKTFNLDYMFSYESEDVQNKVWAFISGDLKMGMFAIPVDEYLGYYEESKRGVVQYKLNLPPDVKIKLWQIMDREIEKGSYLNYDYLQRGCAQSVVQFLLEAAKGRRLEYGPWPEKYKMTRREFVSSNLDDYQWADCQFGLIVGTMADKDVSCPEKVVIPKDVPEVLENATVDGETIITESPMQLVEKNPSIPHEWFTPTHCACIILLLMIGSIWLPGKGSDIADGVFLFFITLIGLFLTYILVFSVLPNTKWNWLIIPFNPMLAICWKWRKYWILPFLVIVLVWIIGMIMYPHTLVNKTFVLLAVCEVVMLMKQATPIRKLLKI